MAKCSAIKRDGKRCERIVSSSQEFCFSHDPDKAQQRSKAASKAASLKNAGSELVQVKARIRELSEAVIEGKVDRGRASVAFQGYGVLRGFLDLERKIKETEELEARLEKLEELAEQRRRGYGI
jgi:hypothetical protein